MPGAQPPWQRNILPESAIGSVEHHHGKLAQFEGILGKMRKHILISVESIMIH